MAASRLSRADFQRLAGANRRIHGAFFSLSVFPLPESEESRYACVVSKRIAAKAVDRNLIKRRCREAVRTHLRKKSGLALVFRAKKEATHAAFADISRDVATLLTAIKS